MTSHADKECVVLDQSDRKPGVLRSRIFKWLLAAMVVAAASHMLAAAVLWRSSPTRIATGGGCPVPWETKEPADELQSIAESVEYDCSLMPRDGVPPCQPRMSVELSDFGATPALRSDLLSELGAVSGSHHGSQSTELFCQMDGVGARQAVNPHGGANAHGGANESHGSPFLSPSLDDFPELRDNRFIRVTDHPLSTFSIDVDTASYSVVRKFLNEGRMPPKDAVRVEELINYFPYDLAPPKGKVPFAVHLEMAAAPWNPDNRLVRIGLKGRTIPNKTRPPLNLVFLLDVSGSMESPNRLPLAVRSMQTLAGQLDARDHVAIVVYAGAAGLVLPPTRGDNSQVIVDALGRLRAGGGTAGGEGIQLAYNTAREHFNPKAVNRVILCTDGDFNVGVTQRGDLERLIEKQAKTGVFLTALGFGMGNYKDSTLELLSNKGNGNYAYIDDFHEARKVLVDQMLGTLVTIAKDVKIQVEFNPAHVAGYRLIGYENRMLRKEDFNNDQIDAGDIGAGHAVTAFYELIPAGRPVSDAPAVDALKYQAAKPADAAADTTELLSVKLRYKQPDGDTSSYLEFALAGDALRSMAQTTPDFRFAAAVAAFGQLLRENEHLEEFGYADILALAEPALGNDRFGYRTEFLKLVRNAKAIDVR